MKNLKFVVLVVIFSAFGFAFLFYSNAAKAEISANENHRCAILPFKQAFKTSTAIFLGEVISEEKSGDVRTFEFKVEKYWKGKVGKKIRIDVYETPRFQAWFKTGERYLIYAVTVDSDEEEGNLRVVRCSRSRTFANAAADLKTLGKGKNPQ